MLIDDKLLAKLENTMKTSPQYVRVMFTPDDNSGSDDYHKGVMMELRNIVRGGRL
jgi:hypothetical protein